MFRKICVGIAAVVLAGSLARGGDVLGVKVEAGLDIGLFSADLVQDAGESFDWDATLIQPYVQVSRFGDGLSFSARLRGILSTDDKDEYLGGDFDTSMRGIEFQALVGYGFSLPVPEWKIIPVAGFSYRNFHAEFDSSGGGDIEYDFDSVTLDFGARVEGPLGEGLALYGQLIFSPILSGDSEIDLVGGSVDDDIDSGMFIELRAGVDWKINDLISVQIGAIYETLDQDTGSDIDATDEFTKFGFQLGVGIRF